MALITKEVEVKLAGNVQYYESCGYEIPRRIDKQGRNSVPRGTTIKIKIEDLPPSSESVVEVECDNCHRHYELKYENYTHHLHNGKLYCCKCANTVLKNKKKSHWL